MNGEVANFADNKFLHGSRDESQLQIAIHNAEPWRSNLLHKSITAQCKAFTFHESIGFTTLDRITHNTCSRCKGTASNYLLELKRCPYIWMRQ